MPCPYEGNLFQNILDEQIKSITISPIKRFCRGDPMWSHAFPFLILYSNFCILYSVF